LPSSRRPAVSYWYHCLLLSSQHLVSWIIPDVINFCEAGGQPLASVPAFRKALRPLRRTQRRRGSDEGAGPGMGGLKSGSWLGLFSGVCVEAIHIRLSVEAGAFSRFPWFAALLKEALGCG